MAVGAKENHTDGVQAHSKSYVQNLKSSMARFF